jgi:hypothetical protein
VHDEAPYEKYSLSAPSTLAQGGNMSRKLLVMSSVILALVLVGLAFSLPCYGATKKALLVGINDYKHLPYYSKELGRMITNLKGAVNDVNAMKDILISQYGFKEKDILVLTNSSATRENILKNFETWLVQGTKRGDVAFFQFSGHGSQVPDQNGDEADGLDEALCAYDVMPKAPSIKEAGLIIDDEIGVLLRKLEGRTVISFVDACHSGTVTRSMGGKPVSSLELTPAYIPKFIPVTIEGARVRGKGFSIDTIPKQDDIPPGQISIFSSLENQVSLELVAPFRSHGALTLGLVEAMKANKNISYKGLYDYAWDFLKNRHGLDQTPLLEPKKGPFLDKPVFTSLISASVASSPPARPVPAKPVEGIRPEPPARPVQVVQAQPPKTPVQEAPIVPSSPPAAESKPDISEQGSGARPNIPEPPPEAKDEKVLVRIDAIKGASAAVLNKMRDSLGKLPYVKLTNEDFFDRIIRGEMKGGVYRLRLVNRIGDAIQITATRNFDQLLKGVSSQLQTDYMVKQFARLHNPNPPFKVKVWVTDEGRNDFGIGEKVEFSFHSEEDCYLLMFNKDVEGNFTILFPNEFHRENFVKGGGTVRIPDRKMGFELEFFPPAGEEMVKVIATKEPIKLSDIGIDDIKPSFGKGGMIVFRSAGSDEVRSIRPVKKAQESLSSGKFTWSDAMTIIRSHPKK